MYQSKLPEPAPHLSDDDLIAHLYGVGQNDGHLSHCEKCQARFAALKSRQQHVLSDVEEVSPERLATQRRRFYSALARPAHWWQAISVRRWAPGGAAAFALVASLFYYGDQQHLRTVRDNAISDAQLAQDVSNLSDTVEAAPTAPLQDLFIE